MSWLFVTLGIAAISAVEYFVDREHHDGARAAGRRSEEALEGRRAKGPTGPPTSEVIRAPPPRVVGSTAAGHRSA